MSGQYHVELRPRSLRYYTMETDIKRCGMFCFTPESGNAQRKMRCPLWVKSRHLQCKTAMSALPPKADMCSATSRMSAKCQMTDYGS